MEEAKIVPYLSASENTNVKDLIAKIEEAKARVDDIFGEDSRRVLRQDKLHEEIPKKWDKFNIFNLIEVILRYYGDDLKYCVSWGQFLVFNGKYYVTEEKDQMLRDILRLAVKYYAGRAENKIDKPFLIRVYELLAIKTKARVRDFELAHDYWAFEDVLYNTMTHETRRFTADILCWKALPYKFSDCVKPCSPGEQGIWDYYIESTCAVSNDELEASNRPREWVYEPTRSDLVQEMIGSIFSGSNKARRMFFLVGDGANGKSVLTETLLRILPTQYTASSNMEQLSGRFGRSRLVGKVANICSEEESQYHKSDVIKATITGEPIDAERKYEDSFAYRNYAVMISATNDIPPFGSFGDALKRRIQVIPFDRKFEIREQDADLIDKLMAVAPTIIGWGLQGLKRLQENNYEYTYNDWAARITGEVEEEASSIVSFVREKCEMDKIYPLITASSLYDGYQDYCRRNGYKYMKKSKFVRRLSKDVRELGGYRQWDTNAKRWRYHLRIKAAQLPDII